MAMISVVVASGGIGGVVVWLSQFAKGPRSTQFITGLMGIVIFIGDYSNAMLVGTDNASAHRPPSRQP